MNMHLSGPGRRARAAAAEELRLLKQIISKTRSERESESLSRQLLRRFGRLANILRASEADLGRVGGYAPDIGRELRAIRDLLTALVRVEVTSRHVIDSPDALFRFCRLHMAGERREQFHVLFLAKDLRLIDHSCMQTGTVDHVTVYPREVMARALEVGATSLILAHNHPSGNPRPSRGDIRMTRQLASAGGYLGIYILDHIVVADSGNFSFRQHGLLDQATPG